MRTLDGARWKPFKPDRMLRTYERVFRPLARNARLLELGVYQGHSLSMWADYFDEGTVVGLDLREPPQALASRVKFYQGSQTDERLLSRIAAESAPDGFDVVIDDCSHLGEWSRISFWHLFDRHLKPGGVYVIEDWGTGFLPHWPDGRPLSHTFRHRESWRSTAWSFVERLLAVAPARVRARSGSIGARLARVIFRRHQLRSHTYGMVGLVKQLLDEFGVEQGRLDPASWIERIEIDASQVFVFKKAKLD
jgi:SAM-dependent methyltransferase